MSLIDFAANLFRDPANARAFQEDPEKALRDAGLPDATPEQVHAVLPTVAESMPPDHPLQSVVQSGGNVAPPSAGDILTGEPTHYYQLGPGDEVINGVAGQSILRPDGSSVLVGPHDVIVPQDAKVHVIGPGDTVIPGFNGMIIEHADGSMTDAGTDSYIVGQEQFVPSPADNASTLLLTEDMDNGDNVPGSEPAGDPEWIPDYIPEMDWTRDDSGDSTPTDPSAHILPGDKNIPYEYPQDTRAEEILLPADDVIHPDQPTLDLSQPHPWDGAQATNENDHIFVPRDANIPNVYGPDESTIDSSPPPVLMPEQNFIPSVYNPDEAPIDVVEQPPVVAEESTFGDIEPTPEDREAAGPEAVF